jgi:hypothetical protein
MTTVDFEPLTLAIPLREEPPGVLRVGKSRVLLELVIHAFKAGATPEAIVQSYDTLNLADVSEDCHVDRKPKNRNPESRTKPPRV